MKEYMGNPFLLIPIEIKVREFHAKLLLSCFAAETGFNVILGDQIELQRHLGSLPKGIYVDKSVVKTKIKSFKKNIKLGNRTVAWCEEGLIFLNPERYIQQRVSAQAFEMIDIFFAWGEVQAEAIQKNIRNSDQKLCITGNPRLDLLRDPYRGIFSSEAKKIREIYGPFILINTNFSLYNHFYGRDFVTNTMKGQGRIKDREDKNFYIKWSDYLGEMYHLFLDMIRDLSLNFSDYTIIIRPHPSENHQTWKDFSRKLPNVEVFHKGNVIEWIMASDVLIHNGCTTGVEAYILGKPVLSYCPITSETYDSILPNALSKKCSSLDELKIQLESIIKNIEEDCLPKPNAPDKVSLLKKYVHGAQGLTACENIIAALNKLAIQYPCLHNHDGFSTMNITRRKLNNLIATAKPFIKKYLNIGTKLDEYVQQKFPGLKIEEIMELIKTLQNHTNRFATINVKPIPATTSCYMIFNKE
ncbi:MAG: hypothetical protein JW932_14710 [Deltaproteobacteria bacterium]|nr:hypothetical protein [Deltaproteobacteria bacterium]